MNQLPREGCACPTTNGQQWHTYDCTFAETPSVSWEVAFDEKFKGQAYLYDHVMKDFIRETLRSQREELCGRLEGLRKRHKEFECNKAYGGRGCFETFCEDQECQNAPKEYNQAIDDAIKAIKSSTKNLSGNLAEEIIDEIIEETIVQAIKNND